MVLTDGLDTLKAILSCIQADGSQVSDVFLEEKQEAKLKKLKISDFSPGMLLLATDEGRKRDKFPACMSPLFADDGTYDQNRACDAVLLRKTDNGYQACYIELKSDAPSGYEGQFKSTRCFIRYVSELSESLCGHPIKLVSERFVGLLYSIPIQRMEADAVSNKKHGLNPKAPTHQTHRTCSVFVMAKQSATLNFSDG